MKFSQVVRVPKERVAVVIGRNGETKRKLESDLGVRVSVDSDTGDVLIYTTDEENEMSSDPFKAVEMVEAIGRGFSPARCERLKKPEVYMNVIDIREYVGKSRNSLERVRGRIIGINGKARRIMEELTGAYISVYGHTVSSIGTKEQNELLSDAVKELASGSEHKVVYSELQKARSQAKLDRLKLWED